MSFLLGGWSGRNHPAGRYIDGKASAWRHDLGVVRATIAFAKKTGRFKTGQAGRLETTTQGWRTRAETRAKDPAEEYIDGKTSAWEEDREIQLRRAGRRVGCKDRK